ncbi:hypothetical protein D1872_181580 [compost metagenome]
MFISTERMLFDLLQVVQERFVTRRIIADCQRVEEYAYQALQFRMWSSGNRRADDNVFLSRIFMQKRAIRGQQYHVQGGAGLRGQLFQLFAVLQADRKFQSSSFQTLYGWSCKIRRHIQHRNVTSHRVQPVAFLLTKTLTLHIGMLPNRIVLVLDAQWRQFLAFIQLRELLHDNSFRDAIRNNMVHVIEHDVTPRSIFYQLNPQQRCLCEIKCTYKVLCVLRCLFFACLHMLHAECDARFNPLNHLTIHHLESGSQGFMTGNQLAEGLFQSHFIQGTFDNQSARHIVANLSTFQVTQHVHPFLRRGNRIIFTLLHHRNRYIRLLGLIFTHQLHQLLNRRILENISQRQLVIQLLMDFRHQGGSAQRMSSHFKEVILDAYLMMIQNALPNTYQLLFQRCARCHVRRASFEARFWRRQRFAVNFSVRCQRETIQLYDIGRDHIARQFGLECAAQIRQIQRLRGYDIRTQILVSVFVFPGGDDGFLNAVHGQQLCFHLAQFNPEAPDFDLIIHPADKVHIAIRHPPRQIACAVQSFTRYIWVRYEFLGCQVCTIQVASCHPGSANAQLTQYADRHRIQLAVHDVEACVQPRLTNRHMAAAWQLRQLFVVEAGVNRRFGDAVAVHNADIRTKPFLQHPVVRHTAAVRTGD